MNARLSPVLLVAAGLAAIPAPAAPKRGAKKEISRLVKQLGSEEFKSREEAVKQLTALGTSALPALRKAIGGKDEEAGRRAKVVIKAIGEQGQKTVNDRLAKLNGAAGAVVKLIDDEALARFFPARLFYAVIYRQFPVGRVPPKPLKVQNLFILGPNGKLQHLTDFQGLLKFFSDHLAPVKNNKAIEEATRAWLALGVQFHQDLFYQFSVPKDGVTVPKEGKRK
jgi:hypothetical protein